MLSRSPVFLLCLVISVSALSIQRGVNHRAVEVSTSALPVTTEAPVTTKVLDSIPSFLNGTQTGQGTFYSTGLGACGIVNHDWDHIAAVSHLLFDAFPGYDGINPNNNPLCGKQVSATHGGKSVTVTLTDRCEACALTDLDFSPAAFDVLADPSVGLISIEWVWLD
ncbi:hypothetical protein C0995_006680 [Termitomyces sp. Mi166|nr:hypothetical protein C0995_006680 [Termitomyces sp. Mi166\